MIHSHWKVNAQSYPALARLADWPDWPSGEYCSLGRSEEPVQIPYPAVGPAVDERPICLFVLLMVSSKREARTGTIPSQYIRA